MVEASRVGGALGLSGTETVGAAGHTAAMTGPRGGGRVYLEVSYSEREQAKALGARWDPTARRWWVPPAATAAQQRWPAQPEVPALLPGEDRTFGDGLFVDLVPTTCWFTNVRSSVAPGDWERLRRTILDRAGRRCEVCGHGEDRTTQRWLEAHERWAFDDHTGVQALRRLILLCTWCHRTTHMGLAELRGHGEEAFDHLCAVTGMNEEQAQDHIDDAYAVWRARNTREWTLDLRILTTAGIELAPPPDRRDRARIAADTLADLDLDLDLGTGAAVDATPHPPAVPEPTSAPAAAGGTSRWRRWIGR